MLVTPMVVSRVAVAGGRVRSRVGMVVTVMIVVGKARRAMPTDSKAPTLCSPSVCSLSLFSASSTSYFLAVVIFSAWNYLRDCGGDCGEKSTLCESLDFPTFWALSRLPSTNCPFFSAFSSQPLIFFASCDRLPLTLRLSASFVLIHTFLCYYLSVAVIVLCCYLHIDANGLGGGQLDLAVRPHVSI